MIFSRQRHSKTTNHEPQTRPTLTEMHLFNTFVATTHLSLLSLMLFKSGPEFRISFRHQFLDGGFRLGEFAQSSALVHLQLIAVLVRIKGGRRAGGGSAALVYSKNCKNKNNKSNTSNKNNTTRTGRPRQPSSPCTNYNRHSRWPTRAPTRLARSPHIRDEHRRHP